MCILVQCPVKQAPDKALRHLTVTQLKTFVSYLSTLSGADSDSSSGFDSSHSANHRSKATKHVNSPPSKSKKSTMLPQTRSKLTEPPASSRSLQRESDESCTAVKSGRTSCLERHSRSPPPLLPKRLGELASERSSRAMPPGWRCSRDQS
jgi:hypothetical protein